MEEHPVKLVMGGPLGAGTVTEWVLAGVGTGTFREWPLGLVYYRSPRQWVVHIWGRYIDYYPALKLLQESLEGLPYAQSSTSVFFAATMVGRLPAILPSLRLSPQLRPS